MSCPSLCSPPFILVRVFGGRLSNLFLCRHKHLFQILSFLIFCFDLGNDFTQVWYILSLCQILIMDLSEEVAETRLYLLWFCLFIWR
jgi:hypothetical protein